MKGTIRISAILSAFLFLQTSVLASAQEQTDSLRLSVLFPQDVMRLDLHYKDNEINLFRFTNDIRWILLNTDSKIGSITISASASPEGSLEHNLELSRGRATVMRNYLMDALHLPEDAFNLNIIGEDWAGLRELVINHDVPDRESILQILDSHADYINGIGNTDEADSPKAELKALNGGRTWAWLLQNIFPELRSSSNDIVCRFTRPVQEKTVTSIVNTVVPGKNDTVVIVQKYVPEIDSAWFAGIYPVPGYYPSQGYGDSGSGSDTGKAKKKRERKTPGYRFAVETNLLFDAVASPNIGVEFPVGNRFSIRADHQFPWYIFDNDKYAYEILNSTAEFRYWFGDREKRSTLTGGYVGIYGGAVKADLEYQSKGWQVPYTWHAGVTGGWSFPLGKRDNWHLDLGVNIGYLPIKYDYYERSEAYGLLLYKYSGEKTWIGPTNVHCTLVWMLPMNRKPKADAKPEKKQRRKGDE